MSDDTETPAPPLLRVVRGEPTPDELAALVAVVAALGSTAGDAPTRLRSQWADASRRMRPPLTAGPGAWRASALPR